MKGPLPAPPNPPDFGFTADFSQPKPALQWNFIRNPDPACYKQEGGRFTILGRKKTLSDPGASPSFAGVRQPAFEIEAEASMLADLAPGTRAGIAVYYNHEHHYDLGLEQNAKGGYTVILNKRIYDLEQESRRETGLPPAKGSPETTGNKLRLRITADRKQYRFSFRWGNGEWQDCGSGVTAGVCTEATGSMTFTGVYIGLFSAGGPANFSGFTLRNLNSEEDQAEYNRIVKEFD
jgi:alpha-N-arabinofuranosidase